MEEDDKLVELDIDYDEGTGDFLVDRSNFIKSLMESIKDYFDYEKILVSKVEKNFTVLNYADESETFYLDDKLDLELKTVVYSVISNNASLIPFIRFKISEDINDNLVIVGIELGDNNSILVPDEDIIDYDYTIDLNARYLVNRLQMSGIISYSYSLSSNKLSMVPSNQISSGLSIDEYEDIDEDDDLLEKTEAVRIPTKGSVVRKRKKKKLRRKRIMMNRRKDPAGYRKRSRSAKLRWRKYRNKYKKAFKKLYRSTRGKKIAKMRGRANSIGRNL